MKEMSEVASHQIHDEIIQKMIAAETTTDLVELREYPYEDHFVVTKDGYYLTLHRIPSQRFGATAWSAPLPYCRPTVVLWHGLCQSSEVFVCHPQISQNMAYVLADSGFDVWMVNVRGNSYSCKHKTLINTSPQYWDFSMDDIAKHDVASIIKYIQSVTGRPFMDVIALGQGALPLLAALSLDMELNVYIRHLFCLGAHLNTTPQWNAQTAVNWLGTTSFGNTLSYLTHKFPRFTSPLMKVLLKHVYGCHLSKAGSPKMALALQAHTLSTSSVSYVMHALEQTTTALKSFVKKPSSSSFVWRATQLFEETPSLVYPTKHISTKMHLFVTTQAKNAWMDLLPSRVAYHVSEEMMQMDYLWAMEAVKIWKGMMDLMRKS